MTTESDKDTTISNLGETLTLLESDWPDLLRADCNPLDIALPLLNESSTGFGLNYNDFMNLKQKFSDDLKRAVNSHYMSFNDSIGSYGISIETLSQSQNTLNKIKDCLNSVEGFVNIRTSIMSEMNAKRMQYGQMIEVLSKVDEVKNGLNDLEDYILNRDFVKGVELVKKIKETGDSWDLWGLDGLLTLKNRLNLSINGLITGIVAQTNQLIYLKDGSNNNEIFGGNQNGRISVNRGLNGFLKQLNDQIVDESDELEIDIGKFNDIRLYLSIIKKLGKEEEFLKTIVAASEKEIKQLIRRTVEEIKQKYPSQIEINISNNVNNTNKLNDVWGSNILQGLNGTIIQECFKNVFKRCTYLMQRHIALFEISKIDGFHYNIEKVWKLLEKQLGLIIFNYIVDEKLLDEVERLNYHSNTNNDGPFFRVPKEFSNVENKPVFQFSKLRLSNSTKKLIETINNIFPGQGKEILINEFDNNELNKEDSIFIGVDDLNDSKKDVLISPSIFNMSFINDYLILFISNISKVYPIDNGKSITNFFNQFMNIVFISQLENTLNYQFDKLCNKKWKSNQLFKASISFKQFFKQVFITLDTSLYFRPPYVHIILKLLHKMNEKYIKLKQQLLKSSKPKLLSIWLNSDQLTSISTKIINKANKDNIIDLQSNEFQTALSIGEKAIPETFKDEFLTLNQFKLLIDLLNAINDTLNWLPKMKRYVPDLSGSISDLDRMKETWKITSNSGFKLNYDNTEENKNGKNNDDESDYYGDNNISTYDGYSNSYGGNDDNDGIYIALDASSEHEFDGIIESLNKSMTDLELVVRYEIRIESLWNIINFMGSKNWNNIDSTINEEVDSEIMEFCDKIGKIDRFFNKINKNLNYFKIIEFNNIKYNVLNGIGFWVERLIVFESRRMSGLNEDGWLKMMVNLRILQQMIRNVDVNVDIDGDDNNNVNGTSNGNENKIVMSKCLKYFELWKNGEKITDRINEVNKEDWGFDEGDWKNLLRLIYSENLSKNVKKVGFVKKRYEDALVKLHENIKISN